MNYPIQILKSQALRHALKIQELENLDHEMYSSMLFTDEEIQNHKKCINDINKAIETLMIVENKLV